MLDQSEGVLPAATVSLESQLTGAARQVETNASGLFTFPFLPVGVYSVTAEQEGFRASRRGDIELNVGQIIRVELALEIGEISETVEVQATAAVIDLESAAVSQTVTERQVRELPLNGRNFMSLLFLGAGAIGTAGEQGARVRSGWTVSIQGARPTSNNYMLDGTANTDTAFNTPAVLLSVDAIQEFKQQTNTYSAEYGFSANQINLVSKSGTNQFHGSLFWFLRNDALDARNFFEADKLPLRQNQFGFVAGGPVFIPKVYDGRNKTFFLVNYEGMRTRVETNRFGIIPSPENLAGRFEETITDPFTGEPFPNGVIPEARVNRLADVARSTVFWPLANTDLPQGNFRGADSEPTDTSQQTYRFDQVLGKYGSLFGRLTTTDLVNTNATQLTPKGDKFIKQDATNWQVSHTAVISPTLVNQFRFGYLKYTADQFGDTMPDADIARLGLSGVFTNLSDQQKTPPQMNVTGFSTGGGAFGAVLLSNQPMIDFSNGTTLIRGNHTLNLGFGYRSWKLERDLANNFLGVYGFEGDFSGHPVADMLLGVFKNARAFVPGSLSSPDAAGNPRGFNFKFFAPYVQDDWKVSPRLTLNMGLRWDYRTMPYEDNDHMAWWNPDNPLGGLLVADEDLVAAGVIDDSGYYVLAGRRNPHPASKNVFVPRVGFAYRPFGEKTVIRGGYGVFFDSAEEREIDGSADVYPYVSRLQPRNFPGEELTTTDELFPDFGDAGPATPAANTSLSVMQSHEKRNPYVQQWTFSIQRSLSRNSTLELNYVGSKGTHLLMRHNFAQALPPTAEELESGTISPVSERRPYPNFPRFTNSLWGGNSSYHSFNTKFEYRASSMILTSVYSWAKSIDNKSAAAGIYTANSGWQGFMNNHDIRRDRGPSDYDVDHRSVTSFVVGLPVGRGQRFLGGASGVTEALLGGWQISGIVTFQGGFPYGIRAEDAGGYLDTAANRANLVGDPNPDGFTPTVEEWFNTAAFEQPSAGHFGDTGRKVLRAPVYSNFDVGLFKNFRVAESATLQFRLESFNMLNHANFLIPINRVQWKRFGVFGVVNGALPGRINQLGLKLLW